MSAGRVAPPPDCCWCNPLRGASPCRIRSGQPPCAIGSFVRQIHTPSEVAHAPSPEYSLLPVPAPAHVEAPDRLLPYIPVVDRSDQRTHVRCAHSRLSRSYSSGLPARSVRAHPPYVATATRSDMHPPVPVRSVRVPRPLYTADAVRPIA